MTNSEVIELIARWREHRDERARTAIVLAFRPLVVRMIYRCKHPRLRVEFRDDAMQEGDWGVAIAIERYREDGGAGFLGYAMHWIRARLSRLVDSLPLVKVSQDEARKLGHGRLRKAREAIEARGEKATDEALAAEIGVSPEAVLGFRLSGIGLRSIDAPGPELESGELSPEELLGDAEGRVEDVTRVYRALSLINRTDAYVLQRTTLADEPETLALVGERLGVSRERARQRHKRGMEQLTAALRRGGER